MISATPINSQVEKVIIALLEAVRENFLPYHQLYTIVSCAYLSHHMTAMMREIGLKLTAAGSLPSLT